ncbi:DUF1345 domain-containing protein [Rouxiella badensis]|uniref:DUF1345 domain-containing protein n=1 Tax=Rouxiella badensis TaxID=1646377 RepID=UPI001D135D49|nr:DUF1345 domain-containing protein [Rouxiella badensis]MCC3732272.1 DUF1345 domain-containing protein [Rouxiella badensis]MCC3759153.1 DUF1345 domain-containing protein [Rouxiella badensis]
MNLLRPFKHYYQSRPRLLAALLLGILSFFALPSNQPLLQRLLISWNVLAWVYLFFLWWMMLRTAPKGIARIARQQDESAKTVLALVCVTCLVSILAILFELGAVKNLHGVDKILHIALTAATLVVSWFLLPTSFTMHYAHMHYLHSDGDEKVLLFPDKIPQPGYWDFAYYSFTLAVAAQTAGNTTVRKITLLQAVLSFIFNLAILGLSINVGAGLMS